MGVKTKAWGPHAWVACHGLAHAIDLFLQSHPKDTVLHQIAVDHWAQCNQRFPCVYCRVSTTKFMTRDRTNPHRIRRARGAGSFAYWMYSIHECVNMKLFWQTVKIDVTKVWEQWFGYQPSFEDVKYVSPHQPLWWFHFFTFVYYVMCDYDMERSTSIKQYLPEVARMLTHMGYTSGVQLSWALEHVQLPDTFDKDRAARIMYVQSVQRAMRLAGGVSIPSPDMIDFVCQRAIVGCDPKDQSKVGCY